MSFATRLLSLNAPARNVCRGRSYVQWSARDRWMLTVDGVRIGRFKTRRLAKKASRRLLGGA